jgi:regulator of replication initiation timing
MKAKELIEKYKNGQRDFRQVDLKGENLAWTTLSDIDFENANLEAVNFKSAILHRVNFRGANLSFADLSSAELIDTDLSSANLLGANLSDAQLNSNINEKTQLPKGIQARIFAGESFRRTEEINKILEKERQKTPLLINTLKKNGDLENKLRNKHEQYQVERKRAGYLMKERDQLRLELQALREDYSKLDQIFRSTKEEKNNFNAALHNLKSNIIFLKNNLQDLTQSLILKQIKELTQASKNAFIRVFNLVTGKSKTS